MKPVTYSRTSWHYRLATVYGMGDTYSTDICAYTRSCLKGLGMIFLCLGLSFICVLIPAEDFIIWAIVSFQSNQLLDLSPVAQTFVFILLILGFVGSIGAITYLYDKYISNDAVAAPKFIKDAYASWKEKTCYRIDFKDKANTNV